MHSDERLDVVDHVVRDLVGRQVDPARLMIIGAEARDRVHHVQFGRTDTVRATSDVDIAIATDDWQTYEDVVATYTRTGSNGVRFVVADMEVDFMPFGRVEDPDGVVTPARRREQMSVFGMADVFSAGTWVDLPSGHRVRFPTAAGYTLLKLRAWVDRGHANDRDAQDLALAVDWYCEDERVREASWNDDRIELMEEYGSNTDHVAARVLGREAAAIVSRPRARELDALLERRPIAAKQFVFSSVRNMALAEREARVGALAAGFAEVARS